MPDFNVKISNTGGEPALEISLDAEGFTILNKEFVPAQESGITTGKGKFDPLIDTLSKRLSSIKRHFLASTFEKMLDAIRVNALEKGNRVEPNFSFYLKPEKKEKVWIAFESSTYMMKRISLPFTTDWGSRIALSSSSVRSSSLYIWKDSGTD
jgi:hypothetical protein